MNQKPRVLIVDASSESRTLLGELLRREGADALEACDAAEAAEVAERESPDAVIVDADNELPRGGIAWEGIGDWADRSGAPVLVLGTNRATADPPPASDFVRKPYHYGALIHKIQHVLAERRAA